MDNQLIVSLFENHLNTISIILGIVSVLFAILGFFSFVQIKKYVTDKVDLTVKNNIKTILENKDFAKMIEDEVNEEIAKYSLTVKELITDKENKGDKI